MKSSYKTLLLWTVLIVCFAGVYSVFGTGRSTSMSFEKLERSIDQQQVERVDVRVRGGEATAELTVHGTRYSSGPWPLQQIAALEGRGVPIVYAEHESGWSAVLSKWAPVLVVVLLIFGVLRKLRGGAVELPKFEPQLLPAPGRVGFERHADVRKLLKELAEAAKRGELRSRRVLISGAPGTGKTTLLRAAAADAGLQTLATPASEFVNLFVGAGAQRIRALFAKAAEVQPVIIALEDLDGFGSRRVGASEDGRADERGQTLLELCQWLDGMKSPPERALFIATTSRPDLLDEALLRPGRFQVHVRLGEDGTAVIETHAVGTASHAG